jgi:hypothetical protein
MRLDQLEKLAARLATKATDGRQDVAGALLIGSVALARESVDSDIDLAILLSGNEAGPCYECVEGVWVGYEFFNIEALRSLGSAPMLNQEHLRNAARLATGKTLMQRDRDLPRILARLRNARPLVEETRRLFTIVDKCGVIAAGRTGRRQLRALQTMAFALSILALNLTPNRFQKPKWVLQDLNESGHSALVELINLLFPPSEQDGFSAEGICGAAYRATALLFRMEGLGEPRYTGSDHDLDYVYRTLLDAESLLGAKRGKEAGFVATWALRLAQRLAESRSPGPSFPRPPKLGEFVELAEVDLPRMPPEAAALALQRIGSEARRLFLAFSSLYGANP